MLHENVLVVYTAIEGSLEPLTALAIGYAGEPHHIPESYAERDAKPRERKPVDDFLIGGAF